MRIEHSLGWVAVAIGVSLGGISAQERGAAKPPATKDIKADPARPAHDAVQLVEFKRRVDAYVEVHNKAKKEVPPFKETTNPADIVKAQEALAAQIRVDRADARHGDIFTPEISNVFRRLLAPELKGEDGKDAKQILKDDAPPSVPYKVNAKYPEGASRPTVPASVLGNLPKLPKEVEYRIIDKNLILLDTEAGIIVDFIANAMR